MSLASLDLITRRRDGKITYRLTVDRNYQGRASYEISTSQVEEARAFLLQFVKEDAANVELTVSASAEDVYRLLGLEPPSWQPPKEPLS